MEIQFAIVRSENREYLCYKAGEAYVDASNPMIAFTAGEDEFEIVEPDSSFRQKEYEFRGERYYLVPRFYRNGWLALILVMVEDEDEYIEKILISAIKQSLKARLPKLNEMTDFDKFIAQEFQGQKFIAHCYEGEKPQLKNVLKAGEDALVLIGPEGDFSEEEVKKAIERGFTPISLGKSRLRTETAALVACHTMNLLNQ